MNSTEKTVELNPDELGLITELQNTIQSLQYRLEGVFTMAVRSRGLHKEGDWVYRDGALHLVTEPVK